jgi:hypothetical protein
MSLDNTGADGRAIEVLQTVYYGKGSVHWIVQALKLDPHGNTKAILKSGLSGRTIVAAVKRLRHHPIERETP